MKPRKPPADAVIFDIDNVLIDTRRSYLDAIRHTVQIYLTHGTIPLFHSRHSARELLLTPHDVDTFKLLGGFNDDWDCCYGLLVYLLSLAVEKRTLEDLRFKIDIKKLGEEIPRRPLGVNGIVKHFGRPPQVRIEKISRIFQEIYRGRDLFEATEKRSAVYWKKRGLIAKEKLIFKTPLLEKLRAWNIPLGISTGRPRFEAVYSLKHFGILSYFSAMTTMDEVRNGEREQKQSLRKPHPYSLLETAKRLGADKKFLYVGDLPDDLLAAHRAKETLDIRAVAFPTYTSDPENAAEELRKAEPDFVINRPSELINIVRGQSLF